MLEILYKIDRVEGLWLGTILIVCILITLALLAFFRQRSGRLRKRRRAVIRNEWDKLIASQLMGDQPLSSAIGSRNPLEKLKHANVKSVVASELVLARNGLQGEFAGQVNRLYEEWQLTAYSLQLMNTRHWHRSAKGIQQLSIMGQVQVEQEVYKRINHENVFIRNEAQIAMLRMRGSRGLGFLNELTTELSEWQQINLLHELRQQQTGTFEEIGNWFLSNNTSVVVFALHIARIFSLFDQATSIQKLVNHPDERVRRLAAEFVEIWPPFYDNVAMLN